MKQFTYLIIVNCEGVEFKSVLVKDKYLFQFKPSGIDISVVEWDFDTQKLLIQSKYIERAGECDPTVLFINLLDKTTNTSLWLKNTVSSLVMNNTIQSLVLVLNNSIPNWLVQSLFVVLNNKRIYSYLSRLRVDFGSAFVMMNSSNWRLVELRYWSDRRYFEKQFVEQQYGVETFNFLNFEEISVLMCMILKLLHRFSIYMKGILKREFSRSSLTRNLEYYS